MNTVQKIVDLMNEKKITASQLTKDGVLSNGLITQWKKGLQQPSLTNIKKIAEYFGVGVEYFIDSENVSETDTNKKMRSPEDERILDLLKKDESIASYVNALANLPPEARKQAAEYVELLALKDKGAHHK